jgi:hypothetical protein
MLGVATSPKLLQERPTSVWFEKSLPILMLPTVTTSVSALEGVLLDDGAFRPLTSGACGR